MGRTALYIGRFFLLFLFIFSGLRELKSEQPLAVKELLKSFKHLEFMEMHCEIKSSISNNIDHSSDSNENEWLVLKRNKNLLYLLKRSEIISSRYHSFLHQEFIIKKDESWYFQSEADEYFNQVNDGNMALILRNDGLAGEPIKKTPQYVLNAAGSSTLVFGLLNCVSMKELFVGSIAVSKDGENGLVRIISVSKYGNLDIWVDPKKGYLPRKFELIVSGEQIINKRKTNEWNMNGGGVYPPGGIEKLVISANKIEIDNHEKKYFIKKIKVDNRLFTTVGPVVKTIFDVSIKKAKFNPMLTEKDYTTVLSIPNGQRVQVEGTEGLSYIWKDGKAVPDPDKN